MMSLSEEGHCLEGLKLAEPIHRALGSRSSNQGWQSGSYCPSQVFLLNSLPGFQHLHEWRSGQNALCHFVMRRKSKQAAGCSRDFLGRLGDFGI